MKIAQVNVYFQPFLVGGAEWYVYNVSRELSRRKHDVHVFTASTYGEKTAPGSEIIDGISVHRLPMRLDWSYRMKVWKGLYESLVREGFDIIHTYDYAQPHSVDAVRAGSFNGSASVLTVFDVHSMIPRAWYKQLPMKLMERYLARRTLPGASAILVRAPNLVEPIVELGGPRDRIRVTPSGVRDESFGSYDGKGFLTRHGIGGSPVILYVGRLNPLKGPQHILEAAPQVLKKFPDSQFVFVGPDQSGYRQTLEGLASKLGVGANVRFLGPIYDFQEKMSAYASCDVFVLPTSYEGTSQSIFEAMAQGRPVVATEVGGVPYQISDGVEGKLIPDSSPESLSPAIISILEDKRASAEMGRKGKSRVESNRYSVLTSDLEKIYQGASATN